MKILCIAGKAGSGKDTAASMIKAELINRGESVLVIHFADLLKYVLRDYFNWDGVKDEHGRYLLQYIGTDVVRKKNENFWVNFVADFLEVFNAYWGYAIIPDVRFENEIRVLSERGFDVRTICVSRRNFTTQLTDDQQRHESETALDDYKFDVTIENDGSFEDLRNKISKFLNEYTGR